MDTLIVKEGQDNVPKDDKVLQKVQTVQKVVGETTLAELKETLTHHTELRDQYIESVNSLKQQIKDAETALA